MIFHFLLLFVSKPEQKDYIFVANNVISLLVFIPFCGHGPVIMTPRPDRLEQG